MPIVPAAVIFDLGRGGVFTNRPDADVRIPSLRRGPKPAPSPWAPSGPVPVRMAGGLQGGVGTASVTLADGIVVGALAVVNAAGQVIDPAHRAAPVPRADQPPPPAGRAATGVGRGDTACRPTPLNTTIGVGGDIGGADQAGMRQDGRRSPTTAWPGRSARCTRCSTETPSSACRPASTRLRSATPPALRRPDTRPAIVNTLLAAAADCFALACTRAVIEARSFGGAPSYADLCPDAFPPTR